MGITFDFQNWICSKANCLKYDEPYYISADALHPNNNAESVNIGAALDYKIPGFGQVSLTSGAKNGMKSINSDGNDFSITFGIGAKMFYLANKSLSIDYTYKPMGILGNVQMYTVGVSF